MPCPTCSSTLCQPITLLDGAITCTYSEAWRHECEARTILNMTPLAARRAYLYGTLDRWGKLSGGVDKKRGPVALKQLEDTMVLLWRKRVADAKSQLLGDKHANDNHSSALPAPARHA